MKLVSVSGWCCKPCSLSGEGSFLSRPFMELRCRFMLLLFVFLTVGGGFGCLYSGWQLEEGEGSTWMWLDKKRFCNTVFQNWVKGNQQGIKPPVKGFETFLVSPLHP